MLDPDIRGHKFWEVMPSQNNVHIISSVESASFPIATSHWNQQFYLSTPTRIWNSKLVLANILLVLFLRKWNNYPLSRDKEMEQLSSVKRHHILQHLRSVMVLLHILLFCLQMFPQPWRHVSTVKGRWEMNPSTHSES